MMMDETRFKTLLDAYGTRWTAWPEAGRDEARALLAASPRLQQLWQDAGMIDDLLDDAPAVQISPALRERVIASAAVAGLRSRRRYGQVWAWLSSAGVAATAVAGAAFGVMISHQINTAVHADAVLYQASLNATDDTEVLSFEMAALSTDGR